MEPPPSPLASYLVHSDSTADDDADTADDRVHSDASTAELAASVPPARSMLDDFRRGVLISDDDDDGTGSMESSGSSSWSDAVVPGRRRGGLLRRPHMPDWSPSASLERESASAAAAPLSGEEDSSGSSRGPTSQSPIRRKLPSSGRRPRGRAGERAPAALPAAAERAGVEVSPRCLDFGSVVQWCSSARVLSVHNPSRFAARLRGAIIGADGASAPGAFQLRLDAGWPVLPPMSTVSLEVSLAPLDVGTYAACLVVHATTDGGGSAQVAAVCDLRGCCAESPLQLSREQDGETPAALRFHNISADPIAFSVTADEPFRVSPSALTLHPGELHVSVIEPDSMSSNSPPAWVTVHDSTNANMHRLELSSGAAALDHVPVALEAPAARTAALDALARPSAIALADSIVARDTDGADRFALVGVNTEVHIEVHNAHSVPVQLTPRLSVGRASAVMTLKSAVPVMATSSAPSVFTICVCATEVGTYACELELLCMDKSFVSVPVRLKVEEENWVVDAGGGGSESLDFGTVDSHGLHVLSMQIHNRSLVPTAVQINLLGPENPSTGAALPRCFSVALDQPGSQDYAPASGENLPSDGDGLVVQLPACTDEGGRATVHVRFELPPDCRRTANESVIECSGLLRLQSFSPEGEPARAPKTVQQLELLAKAGTPRLQVPGGEQLLLFCIDSPSAGVCTQRLTLRNYGSVEASCQLSTTDESFHAEPQAIVVGPSKVVAVIVTFAALCIDARDREIEHGGQNTITGHLNVSTAYELFQVPLRAEIRTHPHLVCSAPVVNWGCVELGSTQRQSILVRNRSSFGCEIFAAIADLDGPEQPCPCPFAIEGDEIVHLHANAGHEIVLSFTPSEVAFVRHGLFIRDKCGRTYKIPLLGAGGKSQISLQLEHDARLLDFCSGALPGKPLRKTLRLHNNGTRTGFVHVDCTSANSDVVLVGPSNAASVVIAPNKSHEFVLERRQTDAASSTVHRETSLDVYCGDELARRRRRQCRHTRWAEDLGFSGFSPGRDAFDDTFYNEEFFVEPQQEEEDGVASTAHEEDTMFDDYFDEPIFEAQLKRLSVPLILKVDSAAGEDEGPHGPGIARLAEPSIPRIPLATKKAEEDVPTASRSPLSEHRKENYGVEQSQSQASSAQFTCFALMPRGYLLQCALTAGERIGTPRHPECLHTHVHRLEFPPTSLGASMTNQLELCNGHKREITVVGAPISLRKHTAPAIDTHKPALFCVCICSDGCHLSLCCPAPKISYTQQVANPAACEVRACCHGLRASAHAHFDDRAG